jgi:fructose-bisphosphate aldolase class I
MERLDAICRSGNGPWKSSFSFGHALQNAAMKTWNSSAANVALAQAVLFQQARCNRLAVQGRYSPSLEEVVFG